MDARRPARPSSGIWPGSRATAWSTSCTSMRWQWRSVWDALSRAVPRPPERPAGPADLRAQFQTCIGRVEAAGLIRRLPSGNLVLLQPETLDAYASALVNAARDEPDGEGSIAEA